MPTLTLSPIDLLDLHTAQRGNLSDQVEASALSAFGLLPGFDAEAEVDRALAEFFPSTDELLEVGQPMVEDFLSQMFPVVTAGQELMAASTTNYLVNSVASLTGTPPVLTQAALTGVAALRQTPFYQVYKRPLLVVAGALAVGIGGAVAYNMGRERLRKTVSDDLNLAHRSAVMNVINSDDRIAGYRRVIRPELSKGKVCGLCIAACDRRYSRSDLMPLHTDCHCGVMPVVRTSRGKVKDPGRTLNGESITDLYNQATEASDGSTDYASLRRVKFTVHEHGELGPVLRKAGDHFTDLAEAQSNAA